VCCTEDILVDADLTGGRGGGAFFTGVFVLSVSLSFTATIFTSSEGEGGVRRGGGEVAGSGGGEGDLTPRELSPDRTRGSE
jgi:hypothetical protein